MTKHVKSSGWKISSSGVSDAAAAGLSTLCIIHCLALPLLATALPLASVLAENEWIHRGLVLSAMPISAYAIFKTWPRLWDRFFVLLIAVGFALLLAAGFVEAVHDYEKTLTTIGALMVGGAHLWRLTRHKSAG